LEHDCESGDRCVQYEDEDIEMQDWTSIAVACKECIDQKRDTIYCSIGCAASNLSRHRHEKHGLKTAAYEIKKLAVPLWEVVEKTLKEANPGLKYTVVE